MLFENGILVVTFRYSKTIQFSGRLLHTPLLEIPDSIVCPVTAFQNMFSKVNIKSDEPLFSLPSKKCIFYREFQLIIKELIEKIGLNPDNYSSHSFRRGGTSFTLKAGVRADLIQLHGDWRSDAYKKYLSLTFKDKIRVAEKMSKLILSEIR